MSWRPRCGSARRSWRGASRWAISPAGSLPQCRNCAAGWKRRGVIRCGRRNIRRWKRHWPWRGRRRADMLHPLDLWVIGVYLLAITAFGVWLRRPNPTLHDYFLAGSQLPWWAISFSIVAAETSVLTIISTPGLAFSGDLGFLQLVFGYLVARILICLILLPAYFRQRLLTAYQLIQQRFGTGAKTAAGLIFLVGRSLAEGVRVYAVAIVVEVILDSLPAGWHLHLSPITVLGLIAVLTLIYTFEGGLRAVVWTDFIQICIYIAGAVLSLVLLVKALPGGWQTAAAVAAAHGDKLRIFHFNF